MKSIIKELRAEARKLGAVLKAAREPEGFGELGDLRARLRRDGRL